MLCILCLKYKLYIHIIFQYASNDIPHIHKQHVLKKQTLCATKYRGPGICMIYTHKTKSN